MQIFIDTMYSTSDAVCAYMRNMSIKLVKCVCSTAAKIQVPEATISPTERIQNVDVTYVLTTLFCLNRAHMFHYV